LQKGRRGSEVKSNPMPRNSIKEHLHDRTGNTMVGTHPPRPNELDQQPWTSFDFSALSKGRLYFYVGSGLSRAVGLVGWEEMACMVWWYLANYEGRLPSKACPKKVGLENSEFLHWFVNLESTDRRGKQTRILSHESRDPSSRGRTVLLNLILRYREPIAEYITKNGKAKKKTPDRLRTRCGKEPEPEDLVLQSFIWRTGCHGVLTSNYDMLLEHAYSTFNHGSALRSYRYNADFLRHLMTNRRFVLKLHGDINDIGTMQFNPEEFWKGQDERHRRYQKDLTRVYRASLTRVTLYMWARDFGTPPLPTYINIGGTSNPKLEGEETRARRSALHLCRTMSSPT
jgi:hypothetical protein